MIPDKSQEQSKTKNLTTYIRDFESKSDFKKYIIISIIILILFESLLGIGFNQFFSDTIENNRKQNYTKAWNNYIQQKWKADYSKITGYIWWESVWEKLYAGDVKQLDLAFSADATIRENYDFFSIYLKRDSDPVFSIVGKNSTEIKFPNANLIEHFFDLQNLKEGNLQTIVKLKDNRFFIISVSALCDDLGKPIYPGIAIFAHDLNKFLRLAEEVIPVSLEIKNGKPPKDIYHYFTIPNEFGEKEDFFIEIKPELEIKTLVFKALFFFILMQILLTLFLFIILAPRYTKGKTKRLEEIIKVSELLNQELSDKIKEIKSAQSETQKSEAKYKHLVESSQDIIFSFDQNGFILTANKALVDFLGFKKEDLIGKFFLDLAYNSEKKIDSLEKQLLMEKFEELKSNESSVSFDMTFGTKNNEPLQLGVKWEYVKIGDNFMVFGKSFTVSEDSMLKYFESENRKYVFKNYITLAEQVSQRITSNLIKYIEMQDVFNIRICVREIIINAIEHGNLEIDFETKTQLRKTKGAYFHFIQERQNDSRFKERKVTVWYSLKPQRVTFLIKDEGKGFNHKKMMADNSETANLNFLDHGRGIFMTKNTFDYIKYNDKGNSVLLVKKFQN